MKLLAILLFFAHPADRFCPDEPFPPDYIEKQFVGFDPATPTPVHCEKYIPSLCHDDPEFVAGILHYWHERRNLLDMIHRFDEARERMKAYATVWAVRKKKNVPALPTFDFEPLPDQLETQSNFIDYWNRIARSPETVACAKWRNEGEWSRGTAIFYLKEHATAAEYHIQLLLKRLEVVQFFESYFYNLATKK